MMSRPVRRVVSGFMTIGVVAVMLSAGASRVRAQDDHSGPLQALLDKTGLKNKQVTGGWEIPYTSKDGKPIKVYLAYNDNSRQYALIFSTVVDKPDNFAFSREFFRQILQMSNDFCGYKYVLDEKHGDIDIQTEVLMSIITPDLLKFYIDAVASAVDRDGQKLNSIAG